MKKKTLALVLALTLLVAGVVGGTLAWLTDQTAEVKNTFTVGDINIGLTETTADYKMVPGNTIAKDPTVTVEANSEACWLFVKVENGIADIEDSTNTIAAQLAAKGWTAVDGATNVYAYKSTVAGGANVPVFESFKIDQSVIGGNKPVDYVGENKYLGDYTDKKIVVTAYAIQADGFDDAAAAWTAYAAK